MWAEVGTMVNWRKRMRSRSASFTVRFRLEKLNRRTGASSTTPRPAYGNRSICSELPSKHASISHAGTYPGWVSVPAQDSWTFDERQSKLAEAAGLKTAWTSHYSRLRSFPARATREWKPCSSASAGEGVIAPAIGRGGPEAGARRHPVVVRRRPRRMWMTSLREPALKRMSKWRFETVLLWIACFVVACVFIWTSADNGVPALRQDWDMPRSYAAEPGYFRGMYEPWLPVGLGAPQPYPTMFLLGFAGRLLAPLIPSPWILLLLFLAAIAALTLISSARLLSSLKVPAAITFAGATFALLNPWVYTKLVAGHFIMVAAYGATIGIVAEFLRPQPRARVLIPLTIVAMMQLQWMLLVGGAVFAYFLLRRRWIGAVTLFLVALPSILGIIAYHDQLLGTPYLLSWQRNQSVAPSQAIVLGGYFARYADHMLGIARIPVVVFVLMAAAGLVLGFKHRLVRWSAAAMTLALVVAMGAKGPLAPLYLFVVRTIPESGVFRELYDLLAFAAIGYLILYGFCASRVRQLSLVALPAAIALLASWVAYPPAAFWVNAATIPRLHIAPARGRFALFPAFQPLTFRGKGSGADPNAQVRFHGPTALNGYLPGFPIDVALARYALYGDPRMLGALGVSMIYDRPYFESDPLALGQTIAHAAGWRAALNHPVESAHISATPLASLADHLALASVANDPSRTAVFVADVPTDLANRFGLSRPVAIAPIPLQRTTVDADEGWVDARLAFVTDPDLGQAFGGAYTQTARRPLTLPPGQRVLAFIRGALVAEGSRWRIGTTQGYRWIDLPGNVSAVRCLGSCAIALVGNVDPHVPRNGPPMNLSGLRSRRLAPWLIRVEIPRGKREPLLRINEAYSPYWVAITPSGARPPHVRIDTALNGYLDPPTGTTYVVQVMALAQLAIELFAAFWCVALAAYLVRQYGRAVRASTTRGPPFHIVLHRIMTTHIKSRASRGLIRTENFRGLSQRSENGEPRRSAVGAVPGNDRGV